MHPPPGRESGCGMNPTDTIARARGHLSDCIILLRDLEQDRVRTALLHLAAASMELRAEEDESREREAGVA